MIAIEQWRGQIGSFNRCKNFCQINECKDSPISSTKLYLDVLQTMMSAVVISMLLIIGGVESNPGPPKNIQQGKLSVKPNLLQTVYLKLLVCQIFISLFKYRLQIKHVIVNVTIRPSVNENLAPLSYSSRVYQDQLKHNKYHKSTM